MLGKRFQQNSNMKFDQLHDFLLQNVGWTKYIMSSPVQKLGEHVPPINSVPATDTNDRNVSVTKMSRRKKQPSTVD